MELWLVLFFFSLGAGALTTRLLFTRDRRIKRLLRSTRATLVRDARDGKAIKIVGELVYAGRPVEAPLSLRACAYYSVRVAEYRGHGPRGGHWHEIVREERGVDFYVRDESGMALVRVASDGRDFPALVQDRKARTSPIVRDDADLERFMRARGKSVEGTFLRKNLRAYEGVLEAGERVAVAGLARWLPDPDAAGGNYRETPKRLVLQASDSLPLFLSDDPAAL